MTTDGNRVLTTSEANIQTVSIDVCVIRIGKRQMTLSVFRQLQSERLIDPFKKTLAGIPWGIVNYHGGGDCFPHDHLHIVWQKGNELRRDSVPESMRLSYPDWFESNQRERERLNELVLLSLCPPHRPDKDWEKTAPLVEDRYGTPGKQYPFEVPRPWSLERRYQDHLPRECYNAQTYVNYFLYLCAFRYPHSDREDRQRTFLECMDRIQDYSQHVRQSLAKYHGIRVEAQEREDWMHLLEEHYWDSIKRRDALQVYWEEQYAELAALDQLFIAV